MDSPPSGNAGPHQQQPTRYTRRTQELPPRLQIMGLAHPKTPFRQYQVPHRSEPAVVEEDVPRPFILPAGYAKAPFVGCAKEITVGSWVRNFSRVEHLHVSEDAIDHSFIKSTAPFVRFHRSSRPHLS